MTFFDPERTLICDTECYPNFWSIGFRRASDAKTRVFEHSVRKPITDAQIDTISAIMRQNKIVGFNFLGYDAPMIALMLGGASNAKLKQGNDSIILGGLRYWQVEEALHVRVPREWDMIDMIEPQPNAFASLKTLNGRLHGRKMQDLPYSPDQVLTEQQMDDVLAYMGNDLEATHILFDALKEPLQLRAALRQEYDFNFMSKSDSQIGEGIIKKVVEQKTGVKVERPTVRAGHQFSYKPPAFLAYENPELQDIVDRLRTTEFVIKFDGKVGLPPWLEGKTIVIGGTEFAVGIGGLHSTESRRAVHADDDYAMVDVDVTGYYGQIIINSKQYPTAIGPAFCPIFEEIKTSRDKLKPKLKDPNTPKSELPAIEASVGGKKIVTNGTFGKTSSPHSSLYAPHLMIYTTLTGQLSILMLIDRIVAAGMQVVSANTDGVVIRVPRAMWGGLDGDRFAESEIKDVVEQWEQDTGFNLEAVEYQSLYNLSVNTYIAVKPDGKVKRKGTLSNPWREKDMRGLLMKNPNAVVCADAVVEFITKGTPIEDYIRGCTDVRDFVTVVNVKGGGTWQPAEFCFVDDWVPYYGGSWIRQEWVDRQLPYDRMALSGPARPAPVAKQTGGGVEYLGKVVRYYWAKDGSPIFYKNPDPRTGNHKKVSKTDGCRPLMDYGDYSLPTDIDYARYIAEAREIMMDIGAEHRPPPVKPIRLYKYNHPLLWFALAA
jgi:hypothetical protein